MNVRISEQPNGVSRSNVARWFLHGGDALGAYQAGVYRLGRRPLIGAINSAIIVG
jgi:hypothetical protein